MLVGSALGDLPHRVRVSGDQALPALLIGREPSCPEGRVEAATGLIVLLERTLELEGAGWARVLTLVRVWFVVDCGRFLGFCSWRDAARWISLGEEAQGAPSIGMASLDARRSSTSTPALHLGFTRTCEGLSVLHFHTSLALFRHLFGTLNHVHLGVSCAAGTRTSSGRVASSWR